MGILVGARLAWDPRIVGGDLSTTPIFNWLLFGYGIPALGFAVAGRVMRSRGDDTPVRVADALAVLFAAFLVFFEIRHAMNGGDPFAPGSGLLEQGLLAVASFGFGIVLTRLDAVARQRGVPHRLARGRRDRHGARRHRPRPALESAAVGPSRSKAA